MVLVFIGMSLRRKKINIELLIIIFGLINSKTTINDLKTIFGEDNVKIFERQSCAGEQYISYYVETEDVEFYTDDYYGGFWIIVSSNKKFQTEDGLRVGSN